LTRSNVLSLKWQCPTDPVRACPETQLDYSNYDLTRHCICSSVKHNYIQVFQDSTNFDLSKFLISKHELIVEGFFLYNKANLVLISQMFDLGQSLIFCCKFFVLLNFFLNNWNEILWINKAIYVCLAISKK
jgi:hypothetical protein